MLFFSTLHTPHSLLFPTFLSFNFSNIFFELFQFFTAARRCAAPCACRLRAAPPNCTLSLGPPTTFPAAARFPPRCCGATARCSPHFRRLPHFRLADRLDAQLEPEKAEREVGGAHGEQRVQVGFLGNGRWQRQKKSKAKQQKDKFCFVFFFLFCF